jgi:hypothetical protein
VTALLILVVTILVDVALIVLRSELEPAQFEAVLGMIFTERAARGATAGKS